MNINKKYAIYAIIAAQLFFLSSMIWFHATKLQHAEKIMLKTVPYDPMSMFRGRYANLRYDISSLPSTLLKDASSADLKNGDELFVALKKDGNYWVAEGIYKNRNNCQSPIFLQGRLQHYYWYQNQSTPQNLNLQYGIESFFLNEKSADEVDRTNRRQPMDWKKITQQKEERIAALDEETKRIKKANISKWWFKLLDSEMEIWVKEGVIDQKAKDTIHVKYSDAVEKLDAIEKESYQIRPQDQKTVVVEVAVDRQGNGYPTRLFLDGKEYK